MSACEPSGPSPRLPSQYRNTFLILVFTVWLVLQARQTASDTSHWLDRKKIIPSGDWCSETSSTCGGDTNVIYPYPGYTCIYTVWLVLQARQIVTKTQRYDSLTRPFRKITCSNIHDRRGEKKHDLPRVYICSVPSILSTIKLWAITTWLSMYSPCSLVVRALFFRFPSYIIITTCFVYRNTC